MSFDDAILDAPVGSCPDPDAFLQAAMRWHFSPETGSPFWLRRAAALGFDPLVDVRTFDDLALFPNVVNDLRDVAVEDLVPVGLTDDTVTHVCESGGTTGAPKRLPFLGGWTSRNIGWVSGLLDQAGYPRSGNWLTVVPTGPHMIGEIGRYLAAHRGAMRFCVDLDPRWVKVLVASGRAADADAYADHIVDQTRHILRSQNVAVLMTTPPLLDRLARDEELADLIRTKVKGIMWGGAHMDADSRYLYRTEIFPEARLMGFYGNTMVTSGAPERIGLGDEDPCIFDPPEPNLIMRVVDPATGKPVGYGERGQVVMNHVSRYLLLPNNLERDNATRMPSPGDGPGDSVADVTPVAVFDNETVVEGVY